MFVILISLYGITIGLSITTSVLLLLVHERETFQTEEDVEDLADEIVRNKYPFGSNGSKALAVDRAEAVDEVKRMRLDRLVFSRKTERIRRASKVTLMLQLLFSLITSAMSAAFLSMTSFASDTATAGLNSTT